VSLPDTAQAASGGTARTVALPRAKTRSNGSLPAWRALVDCAIDAHARRSRQALWAALALIVVRGANFSVQRAIFAYLRPGGFLLAR
jgi:hypothetical protein